MMVIKDIWPGILVPIFGFIMGVYHKYLVGPRLKAQDERIEKVEDKTGKHGELLARIDERTEMIWEKIKNMSGCENEK